MDHPFYFSADKNIWCDQVLVVVLLLSRLGSHLQVVKIILTPYIPGIDEIII